MQASSIPPKFPIPFSQAGTKTLIPTASQIGITGGAASLTDGFPPLTFLPVGVGGIPPRGQDMNGILNAITLWTQWLSAGGPITYDAAFSTAIGGYPRGAELTSATGGTWWVSTVDNNVTNPDAGGAGWRALVLGAVAGLNIGAGLYADGNGNLAAANANQDAPYFLGLSI